MYRIVILTGQESQKSFFTERIFKFCAGRGLFPRIEQYCDQESFFEAVRTAAPENAVIALPGVDGLNAAEHLQCPLSHLQDHMVRRSGFFTPCFPASH